MFGSKRLKSEGDGPDSTTDVAKLFFDTFSSRVGWVEQGLRTLGVELDKLKLSSERSQISDLVLLDRIQRAERLLDESLNWIKRVAELVATRTNEARSAPPTPSEAVGDVQYRTPLTQIVSPSGEAGSLSSITTPTEMQALSLLSDKGPLSAPEIGRLVGRSREHTARLMKRLYEEGYVRRDQNRIPFRYSLVDRVRQSFGKTPDPTFQKGTEKSAGEEKGVVAQPPPA